MIDKEDFEDDGFYIPDFLFNVSFITFLDIIIFIFEDYVRHYLYIFFFDIWFNIIPSYYGYILDSWRNRTLWSDIVWFLREIDYKIDLVFLFFVKLISPIFEFFKWLIIRILDITITLAWLYYGVLIKRRGRGLGNLLRRQFRIFFIVFIIVFDGLIIKYKLFLKKYGKFRKLCIYILAH